MQIAPSELQEEKEMTRVDLSSYLTYAYAVSRVDNNLDYTGTYQMSKYAMPAMGGHVKKGYYYSSCAC